MMRHFLISSEFLECITSQPQQSIIPSIELIKLENHTEYVLVSPTLRILDHYWNLVILFSLDIQ